MPTLIKVHSVAQGFNYSAYVGCSRDSKGVIKESADRVVGGWAISTEQAKAQAKEAIVNE